MIDETNYEVSLHTSFKHQKRRRKNKKRRKQSLGSRRKDRLVTLQKRRARLFKYNANQEEKYHTGIALENILEHYRSWLANWQGCSRRLDRRLCFPKASRPFQTFEKVCAAFCGDEDCKSLRNLGCGHWMHPNCLENLLCTMTHDGKDVSSARCPLCKYSLDRMRNDSHYDKIEEECERLFEEELLAAIEASITMDKKPSFASVNLPKTLKTREQSSIFADDFVTPRLKIAEGVQTHVTQYRREGGKIFGKTPGGWLLLLDGEFYYTW